MARFYVRKKKHHTLRGVTANYNNNYTLRLFTTGGHAATQTRIRFDDSESSPYPDGIFAHTIEN